MRVAAGEGVIQNGQCLRAQGPRRVSALAGRTLGLSPTPPAQCAAGVVRVPPAIKPSSSGTAAEGTCDASGSVTPADAASPASGVAIEPHLASAMDYGSTTRGNGAAAPFSQQRIGRIRKLFLRISRGSRDVSRESAALQPMAMLGGWEGAAAERDATVEMIAADGDGDALGGLAAGCLGRRNSRADGILSRSMASEAEQSTSTAAGCRAWRWIGAGSGAGVGIRGRGGDSKRPCMQSRLWRVRRRQQPAGGWQLAAPIRSETATGNLNATWTGGTFWAAQHNFDTGRSWGGVTARLDLGRPAWGQPLL
jgi:hypothetical protein